MNFNNKKYFNTRTTNLLHKKNIIKYLSNNSEKFDITLLNIIDSTNDYLLNNYERSKINNNPISVTSAEIQINGRGRFQKKWHSSLGSGLTFSLIWCFRQNLVSLSGLSLVIGIAIVRVLRLLTNREIHLKWPNDVLHGKSKLAGILIEIRRMLESFSFAIIGIGINFNLPLFLKTSIEQDITDLLHVSGRHLDRNEVLSALLIELHDVLFCFDKYGFAHFKDEWITYHAFQGKRVTLVFPDNRSIDGIVDGVDDDGSIRLITSIGCHSYHSGDISMRLSNQEI